MSIINEQGKLFGRINVIDFIFSSAVVLGVAGVFLVQSGTHVTSGQVVEGESDIVMTIQVPRFTTMDADLFKPGEKTAITVRNQPRGDVLIENVYKSPSRVTMLGSNGKAQAIDDLALGNTYDFTIRLKDHAKITQDGYVTEGVKVKVGLPIELEGFKYRVYGKIVNVEAAKQSS
jgi:hypothetical protein